MKDSEPLKGINPGQPIRFPVEKESRFKGLSAEKWEGKYTVTPIDFGGGVQGSQPKSVGVPVDQPHID